jgi:penicillin amidase
VPPVAWRTAAERPAVVSPPAGRIWTANARVADGEGERTIGSDEADGGLGYDLGARAGQIRDGLLALHRPATPADMLAIQLDDRALFLARWRTLLLGTLDQDSLKDRPRRAELRRLAERWDARAGVDSVGYRVVREFRDAAERAVWDAVLGVAGLAVPGSPPPSRQFEGLLWSLVTEQPQHMLPARYSDWRALLLEQVDAVGESMRDACAVLERCGWGERNPVRIRHPLSRALPWLSRWLDMTTVALPGDHDMPRVQAGAFGASQRFAVSPGRESEGYMQLPGGQSGHPLSAFYAAGFEDWASGRMAPFLPGPAAHKLILVSR